MPTLVANLNQISTAAHRMFAGQDPPKKTVKSSLPGSSASQSPQIEHHSNNSSIGTCLVAVVYMLIMVTYLSTRM